jgi:uncharacterized protein
MNRIKEANRPLSAPRSLQQWMMKHPLISFFILAYALSWILWIPWVATEWGLVPKVLHSTLLHAALTFGPTLAAYIMFRITEGRQGWRNLRSRLKLLRVGWKWYVFILLGIPAMILFGMLILPGAAASFQGLPKNFLMSYPFLFVLVFFGGGPLGEEIGWRGFALPRMQTRFGPLKATLLLGLFWTFWHFPEFFSAAQLGGPGTGWTPFFLHLPIFFVMVMAIAVIFTWVFNHTGGSVFIAILAHASFDTFVFSVQPLFTSPLASSTHLPIALGMVLLAIPILILTRGRLGYRPELEKA